MTVARWWLAAALLVPAGCAGAGDDTTTTTMHIRLVVPDKNVRREGIECAGARPFHYVHAGAHFAIEGEDGTLLEEGELPAGRAENAEPGVDWGVERIPTFCVLDLELDLPERSRYVLRLDRGRPLAFAGASSTRQEPIVLVVG